jgi:hypothetical protein
MLRSSVPALVRSYAGWLYRRGGRGDNGEEGAVQWGEEW